VAAALKLPTSLGGGERLAGWDLWVSKLKTPPPARICTQGRWRRRPRHQNVEKVHLRLTFVREGGGGGGRSVERSRNSTSSLRLYAREVEEMATASKSTSGSHLYAREVEKVGGVSKGRKSPPPARVWTRGRWRRRQRRRNRQHPSLEGKGSLRRPSVLAQPS
jgi:hypothetical protein